MRSLQSRPSPEACLGISVSLSFAGAMLEGHVKDSPHLFQVVTHTWSGGLTTSPTNARPPPRPMRRAIHRQRPHAQRTHHSRARERPSRPNQWRSSYPPVPPFSTLRRRAPGAQLMTFQLRRPWSGQYLRHHRQASSVVLLRRSNQRRRYARTSYYSGPLFECRHCRLGLNRRGEYVYL